MKEGAESSGEAHGLLPKWLNSHRVDIDYAIKMILASQRPEIRHLAEDAVFRGRKLRGTLALQMIEWCDWEIDAAGRVNLLADLAKIEILHSMSCVLDDVIDKDDFRRGEPSFHVRHGRESAILLPLFFVNEYAESAEIRNRAAQVITGELFDSKFIAEFGPDHFEDPVTEYFQKAAPLFALAHSSAAKHAGRSEQEVVQSEKFGAAIGKFYQAANDHHDMFSLPVDIRGDMDEKILLTFGIPFYLNCRKDPKFASNLGRYVTRNELASIIENCRKNGVEAESAQFVKSLKTGVEENFPGKKEVPKELSVMLDMVNTPQFWGYKYSE